MTENPEGNYAAGDESSVEEDAEDADQLVEPTIVLRQTATRYDDRGNKDERYQVEIEYEYGPQIPFTAPIEGTPGAWATGMTAVYPPDFHPVFCWETLNGEKTLRYEWKYSKIGRCVQVIDIVSDGQNRWSYQYNDQEQIIASETDYLSDQNEYVPNMSGQFEYATNSDGEITERKGTGTTTYFEYDDENRVIRMYDPTGAYMETLCEYDEDGNLNNQVVYFDIGNHDSYLRYEYSYDEIGRLAERTRYMGSEGEEQLTEKMVYSYTEL